MTRKSRIEGTGDTCAATIDIGADDGARANIKQCQRERGHGGTHRATFKTKYPHEEKAGTATVTWRRGSKRKAGKR